MALHLASRASEEPVALHCPCAVPLFSAVMGSMQDVDDIGGKAAKESLTEEEFKARQSRSVHAWLVCPAKSAMSMARAAVFCYHSVPCCM